MASTIRLTTDTHRVPKAARWKPDADFKTLFAFCIRFGNDLAHMALVQRAVGDMNFMHCWRLRFEWFRSGQAIHETPRAYTGTTIIWAFYSSYTAV